VQTEESRAHDDDSVGGGCSDCKPSCGVIRGYFKRYSHLSASRRSCFKHRNCPLSAVFADIAPRYLGDGHCALSLNDLARIAVLCSVTNGVVAYSGIFPFPKTSYIKKRKMTYVNASALTPQPLPHDIYALPCKNRFLFCTCPTFSRRRLVAETATHGIRRL
jgi:hypothetical protein